MNNTVLYSLVESCKIINSSKIPKQRLFENIINPAKIVSLQHSISIAFSFVFVSDYFDQGSSIKNDVMYNTSVFCFVFFFFGQPRMAVLERANRSNKNIVSPSFPVIETFSFVFGHYLWGFQRKF